MSISLIVLEPKSKEYSLVNVPLATEDVFDRIWLRGAQHLDAKWLPLFKSGIDLTAADFTCVIQELMSLGEWVKVEALGSDEKRFVLSRIDALLKEFVRLDSETNGNVKVFIG